MCRYLAKNIVASGLSKQCLIQFSYAIGVARPLSIFIDTYGTGKITNEEIIKRIENAVDLTPKGIRKHLNLNRPIYAKTSSYGHFGKEPTTQGHFSWEKLDLVNKLK